jgi:mannosyltransferase OCH1-like enzyme
LTDDAEIRALLDAEHPRELRIIYDLIRLPSSRSDIARLVLLKKYGGFYLDASMQFHSSLNEVLTDNPMLVLVQRDDMPMYRAYPENAHVMGGIIGAPADLPFLDRCLELVVTNLECGVFNTRAWMAAGPGVINAVLLKDQTTHAIKKLSFTKMLEGMVSYRRSPGVSTSWAKNQLNGIIDPALYANGFLEIPAEEPTPWWSRLFGGRERGS